VNSSTSSSEQSKRYVGKLLALFAIPAASLFALAIHLEPLYGDLTRIGGFPEREFGWTQPQIKFAKPLFTLDQYDRYHDVVVLGDSFSRIWPQHQWQNYLVAATGWSLTTLDINMRQLDDILTSRAFRDTPPKVLIVETVERYLPSRVNADAACDTAAQGAAMPRPAAVPAWNGQAIEQATRADRRSQDPADAKLSFAFRYVWTNGFRRLSGRPLTDARKLDLAQPAPFSSRTKNALLVYKDDLSKINLWKATSAARLTCGIEQMRRAVEANGVTRFVFLAVPDKTTAYADYLADKNLVAMSQLRPLLDMNGSVSPRIDLALAAAIRQNQQDVYLPDDTHWGSTGHRIVAETLYRFIAHDDARAMSLK
jgi:hypothetical protein